MALTVRDGFVYYSGPRLQRDTVRAANAHTWRPGRAGVRTDSGYRPVIATDSGCNVIFANNQPAETNDTDVVVYKIMSSSTLFLADLMNGGNDTKALRVNIGDKMGIGVSDSLCYPSEGNDSHLLVKIDDLMWLKEGVFNDSSDCPGRVIFHIEDARLSQEV